MCVLLGELEPRVPSIPFCPRFKRARVCSPWATIALWNEAFRLFFQRNKNVTQKVLHFVLHCDIIRVGKEGYNAI